VGRPRRYCRPSHRQRAYEARRAARRRGLAADEVLLGRAAWERLRDARYRLEAALEDVTRDLAHGGTEEEYAAALAHLARAARQLERVVVEPRALGAP